MSFNGKALRIVDSEIDVLAKELEVEPAAFRAVIAVEAAGSGFDNAGRPKALFERHCFHRQLLGKPELLERAVAAGLAYKSWGTKPYPKGSDAVYDEIRRAVEIDETAALLSTSWGLGQIMGSNYKLAGCTTVREMVEQACESEVNQLRHMGSFLRSTNLLKPLRFKDWAAFAKGYNGPAYATHSYDVKLANAYARFTQPVLQAKKEG